MTIKTEEFLTIEFPQNISVVYIIYFINGGYNIPFYVGETGRLLGRISDYMIANFKAQTDFKVGEAIRYFQETGYKIIIKYKISDERKSEQDKVIREFKNSGWILLNDLKGYDYKKASKKDELMRVKDFCDILITTNLNKL